MNATAAELANPVANPVADPVIVATYHGVEVPQAPHLGKGMIESMEAGRYERREVECGLAAILPGARILEMGAGSGVVGAVLAKNCKPAAMLSIEANPKLLPHINRLYAHNRLTEVISVRHAVVFSAPDAPGEVEFFVHGNFLGSGLVARNVEKATAVQVPVLRYDALRAEFPHDTIMMDIEGGELDFLRHADLGGVQTFIAEFHRDIYGREGMRECRALLEKAGMVMDAELSRGGVHVYRRAQG